MKIKILYDKTRTLSRKNSIIYKSENDYLEAYTDLQAAVKANQDKSIIVYCAALMDWLGRGMKQYKKAEIIEKEINYKDLLAAKWNIEYDIEILDHDIREQKLLDLPLEGVESIFFSSFICENFISVHLNTEKFNKAHFGELITDLLRFNLEKSELPKIVDVVYNYKLNQWIKNSPEHDSIISYILIDLRKLYENLCLYKIINNYPKNFQRKCLDANWLKLFRQARISLTGLEIDKFIKDSELYKNVLLNELNLFLKNFERENTILSEELIDTLLYQFSGEIAEELEYFLNLLKSNTKSINIKLLSKIKVKFQSLLPIYGHIIETLTDYVPPQKPDPFNKNTDTKSILDWAVKSYLPYKFWMETTCKEDQDVLKYGIEFSEYILENYEKISYHFDHVIYRFIFNYKEIIQETQIPIILILDNFNYKFLESLATTFSKYKFTIGKVDPYLSLLPTTTSIAKLAIITGKRDNAENNSLSYEKNIIAIWQDYFPDHQLTYISKAGLLNEYKARGNEFIIINYNGIDEELHQSYQKTAIEHRKTISFIIENIVELIANFIKRNKIENKSKIFLISDHGSTLITQDIKNEIDIDYLKDQEIEPSHRFFEVDDKKFNKMESNANICDSIYFLNKGISGDGRNYIIAKGFDRFKEIKESFYVHGGALPEEILVPVGYFEYSAKEAERLRIQLLKNDYRLMTKESIIIRVANPNNIPAKNILIEIMSNEISLAEIVIQELSDFSEEEITKEIRIRNPNMKLIRADITYEIMNKSYRGTFEFPIDIKTMIETTFDFDNL